LDHLGIVRKDAEIHDLDRQMAQQRPQHEAVGIEHAAHWQGVTGLAEFVAAGEQRHAQVPEDGQLSQPEFCRDPDMLRLEHEPGPEQRLPGPDVLTGTAAVGEGAERLLEGHAGRRGLDLLVHRHRVGALGHHRPGQDLYRVAGRDRCRRRVTGRGPPWCQIEADRPCGGLARRRKGVAVDRGIVEGRHGPRTHQRPRQHPARGIAERNMLGADDRHDAAAQQGQRLGNADMAAAEIEAVAR
jgi:hypothetical protein